MDDIKKETLYRQMITIRYFEEALLDLFSHGKISGTTHTCLGQEAVAVTSMAHVSEGDAVFSNHRCHGHFLAYGGTPEDLFAEIMGSKDGVCAGRGGSQHLCYKTFFTNGVQGGMLPVAAGYALAFKLRNEGKIAIAFVGDGTFGEGILYETMNMAALISIPLLIIVENNGYAQTTPIRAGMSGSITDRVKSFQIECNETESNDFELLYSVFEKAFSYIRTTGKPFCQIIKTYRLAPHSKGDDFRDPSEIAMWREKDPILLARNQIDERRTSETDTEVRKKIASGIEIASRGIPEHPDRLSIGISRIDAFNEAKLLPTPPASRVVESLNQALHYIFETHSDALIIGEDILDPYGGAFRVTKGLSSKFPKRVISSPISEAAIAGIANGAAMNKMRPIVEVMFGDFITLMYDQIVNHGAKFKWMYNNQVNTPVLFRMPTGGKRGYGPTHSQSLEGIFFGVPNVSVVVATPYHNPGQLLYNAYLAAESPVIFVENKSFYSEKLVCENGGKAGNFHVSNQGGIFPTLRLSPEPGSAEATIICYGGGVTTALSASWQLMIEHEMNVEVICPSLVSPLPLRDIYTLISNASAVIIVMDEGYADFGWASHVALQVIREDAKNGVGRRVETIGMKSTFIPSSIQSEEHTYPSVSDLFALVKKAR